MAFGFWASAPPDNITLNHTNKMTDRSFSYFQTGIGGTALASLDTEQLISHTRAAFVDTIASLQDSDGGVLSVSEVHELLIFMIFHIILYIKRFVIQLVF